MKAKNWCQIHTFVLALFRLASTASKRAAKFVGFPAVLLVLPFELCRLQSYGARGVSNPKECKKRMYLTLIPLLHFYYFLVLVGTPPPTTTTTTKKREMNCNAERATSTIATAVRKRAEEYTRRREKKNIPE